VLVYPRRCSALECTAVRSTYGRRWRLGTVGRRPRVQEGARRPPAARCAPRVRSRVRSVLTCSAARSTRGRGRSTGGRTVIERDTRSLGQSRRKNDTRHSDSIDAVHFAHPRYKTMPMHICMQMEESWQIIRRASHMLSRFDPVERKHPCRTYRTYQEREKRHSQQSSTLMSRHAPKKRRTVQEEGYTE
jgi:hypothetical protein